MGYGLRSINAISNQEMVIKVKTNLGLLSNNIVDSNSQSHYESLKQEGKSKVEVDSLIQEDQKMADSLTANTRRVAKVLAPGNVAIENRMFHHMLLAQKLIAASRLDSRESKPSAMLIRHWINALPTTDLSNMIYWDKQQLVEVDSPNLIAQYKQALAFNQRVYKLLVEDSESPYAKTKSLDFDQWVWAFTIVSSRNLVLNNVPYQDTADPNAIFMIVPLLDYLNHSLTPNCVVTGYHD
jgi:SET domain